MLCREKENEAQKTTYCIISLIDLPSSKSKTTGLEHRLLVAWDWVRGEESDYKGAAWEVLGGIGSVLFFNYGHG